MSEQAQGAGAPIVVDVALAMKQLEENLDLAAKLNELAFGPFAARQLAARDDLIEELVEALDDAVGSLKGNGFSVTHLEAVLAKARGVA